MRLLLATALLLSTPVLAAAQSLAPVSADVAGSQPFMVDQLLQRQVQAPAVLSNLQATPLWSTPDGRVLAIVAMADNSIPSKPRSPQISSAADWKLVDVTNFVTSGLLLNLNRSAAVYATVGRGATFSPLYPAAALSCAQILSPGATDSSCAERSAVLAHSGALQIGTDWSILDNLDVDLSYGLTWLRRDATPGMAVPAFDIFGAISSPQFPTLLIPGLEMANVQNGGLSALGHWRMDGADSLDFGASLSRLQLYVPNTPVLTSLNQAAVSFGLHHGSFSGSVTGRVLGPADAFNGPSRWAGLDIGFSWRTPWQGELSFGTQNLWSSGAVPNLADPGAHEVEGNQARVPYVQYHQDL